MAKVNKRVGSVNITLSVSNRDGEIRVSGYAFPFARQFHSVGFVAKKEVDLDTLVAGDAVPEISFGGNSFEGVHMARVVAAAQVAADQANYYAELINACTAKQYGEVLLEAISQGDREYLLDCMLVAPTGAKVEGDDLYLMKALADIINVGELLGHAGPVTAENLDALGQTEKVALFRTCSAHPKFDLEAADGNRSKALGAFVDMVHQNQSVAS